MGRQDWSTESRVHWHRGFETFIRYLSRNPRWAVRYRSLESGKRVGATDWGYWADRWYLKPRKRDSVEKRKELRKTGKWGVRKIRTEFSRSYKKKVLQEGRNGIWVVAECDSWKHSYFVMTSGQKQHSSQMTCILSFFKSYEVKLKKSIKNNNALWQFSNFSLVPISWAFKNHNFPFLL